MKCDDITIRWDLKQAAFTAFCFIKKQWTNFEGQGWKPQHFSYVERTILVSSSCVPQIMSLSNMKESISWFRKSIDVANIYRR